MIQHGRLSGTQSRIHNTVVRIRPCPTAQEFFYLGVAAAEAGDFALAEWYYKRSLDMDASSNADAHVNLSQCYMVKRQYAKAERSVRAALALDPHYPLAWFNLGGALEARHHKREAVAAYRAALSISPGYADAHYNLAGVLLSMKEYGHARDHAMRYIGIARTWQSEAEWVRRAWHIVHATYPVVVWSPKIARATLQLKKLYRTHGVDA